MNRVVSLVLLLLVLLTGCDRVRGTLEIGPAGAPLTTAQLQLVPQTTSPSCPVGLTCLVSLGSALVQVSGTSVTSFLTGARSVNTAARLTGGGPLSSDLTLDLATVGTAGTYANPSSVTTDAYGRVTSITAGGGGGSSVPVTELPYEIAQRDLVWQSGGAAAGTRTVGWNWSIQRAGIVVTGGQVAWPGAAASLKVSIYDVSSGTQLTTKTIAVAGSGLATATFASAFTPTLGQRYWIAVYETTGTYYAGAVSDPTQPVWNPFVSNNVIALRASGYATSDKNPDTVDGGNYPIAPVLGIAP